VVDIGNVICIAVGRRIEGVIDIVGIIDVIGRIGVVDVIDVVDIGGILNVIDIGNVICIAVGRRIEGVIYVVAGIARAVVERIVDAVAVSSALAINSCSLLRCSSHRLGCKDRNRSWRCGTSRRLGVQNSRSCHRGT